MSELVVHGRGVTRPEFSNAIAEYKAAWRAMEDHPYAGMYPFDPGYKEAMEASSATIKACTAALERLLEVPAESAREVLLKIDTLLFDYRGEAIDESHIELVARDLRRLAAMEAR